VAAAQTATPYAEQQTPTPPTTTEDPLVAAALHALASDEERVGQLLMLGWPQGVENAREMIRLLRPGAIVQITNTDSAPIATTINAQLLAMAKQYGVLTPLLAVDHEGGRVQRIKDVANTGTNWSFGLGSPSDSAACNRGQRHAQQLRDMGFSMNLAPVLDVNNNPANPVIGDRSYSADPELVARLGSAYIRGLQGGGIAAVGKHFPGHGNTSVDSHLSLPVLTHSLAELERVELVPFRRAIDPSTGVAAVMSAHIAFPALDPTRAPATLSQPIMRGLLRDHLGFDGLVLSDDMGVMKAITDNYTPGAAAVQALAAGVDMLIIAGPLDRQVASRDAVLNALRSGELSSERVDDAVRRVLRVKARFGLLGEAAPAVAGCE
jgi:beta-N-acetylhexosaminidase